MFEFTKLCNEYEKLSPAERHVLLVENSAKILARLRLLGADAVIDPVETLACFILSSIVSDGKLDEREYLLMYPALIEAFGADFDFPSVKALVSGNQDLKKQTTDYAETLAALLAAADEEFMQDVIGLCLCVVSIDGKISLREKNYIKKLCKV